MSPPLAQRPARRGEDGQDAPLGEAHKQEAAQEEPDWGAGQALCQVSIRFFTFECGKANAGQWTMDLDVVLVLSPWKNLALEEWKTFVSLKNLGEQLAQFTVILKTNC